VVTEGEELLRRKEPVRTEICRGLTEEERHSGGSGRGLTEENEEVVKEEKNDGEEMSP
jgi:hypothetical protein